MDKLRALEYFVAAAEAQSFAGAARALDVSVPSVHKLVTALEQKLGVTLFSRSARGLSLTASGESYLESCRPLLEEMAAIDRSVSRVGQEASGLVVVGAPPQLAHHFLLPALPRFRARWPDIHIDFRVVHRTTDVDAAPVDVFLLHGWPETQDLVHRRLGRARTFVAATPGYWTQHGIPEHPSGLASHACLMVRNPAGILIDLWDFARGQERVSVKLGGWLSSNDREVVLDAVLAGQGIGRFSQFSTLSHLRSGQLVPVLLDWEVQGGPPLNLLHRAVHRRAPQVRVFLDFVATLLEEADAETAGAGPFGHADRPQWHRRGYGRASSVLRGQPFR